MKSSVARIYRYVRFRKGHGVHSPFAFGLINKVIEEKKSYYAFEEIEKDTSRLRLKIAPRKKYGRLLFRLVTFFKSQTVLQIGVSDGILTRYLKAAAPQAVVLEDNYVQRLDGTVRSMGTLDFVFLNTSGDPELTKQLLDKCIRYADSNAVFVLDGIHKKRMRKLWLQTKTRYDIPVTMDLYALGLLFFNRKMNKKNYKLFF